MYTDDGNDASTIIYTMSQVYMSLSLIEPRAHRGETSIVSIDS